MSFMELQAVFGSFTEVVECGDTRWVPTEYLVSDMETGDERKGWFARYSAPGYLDCTEWSGPYDTEEEAREDVREMFGEEEGEST